VVEIQTNLFASKAMSLIQAKAELEKTIFARFNGEFKSYFVLICAKGYTFKKEDLKVDGMFPYGIEDVHLITQMK
jgi:hypothetical protein